MDEMAWTGAMALLGRASFFAGVPPSALELALRLSHRRELARQRFLFYQDEPATTCYIVMEGQVRLAQLSAEGHQVVLRYMGPGDVIGVIVALCDMPYPVSAEAVTDCVLLGWTCEQMKRLMEECPQLALNGMREIASRFRALQQQYRELSTERVERRVARALLRLARHSGRRVPSGVLVDFPLSRQDLGEMTGTTLYTISRILSGWEQAGLIETGRERIVIRDTHGLVTIAEDLPPGAGQPPGE